MTDPTTERGLDGHPLEADTRWAHTLATAFEAGLLGAGDDLPDTWADTYDPEDPADDALLAGRAIGRRILGLDPEALFLMPPLLGPTLPCSVCGGLGILWDQGYGHAALNEHEVPVQCCDSCEALPYDEDAAIAIGLLIPRATHRWVDAALEDGDERPPGDYAVTLPEGWTSDQVQQHLIDIARARFS